MWGVLGRSSASNMFPRSKVKQLPFKLFLCKLANFSRLELSCFTLIVFPRRVSFDTAECRCQRCKSLFQLAIRTKAVTFQEVLKNENQQPPYCQLLIITLINPWRGFPWTCKWWTELKWQRLHLSWLSCNWCLSKIFLELGLELVVQDLSNDPAEVFSKGPLTCQHLQLGLYVTQI